MSDAIRAATLEAESADGEEVVYTLGPVVTI
jgi:hypothetical protein